MHVLLIDDDINLCKILSYQLEKTGYDVKPVNLGREGLDLFGKTPFDIVITDIQMPDLSGMDVLQAIRLKNQDTIVIIITAYGSVDSAIEACRLGADDYLTKPFGQEQLRFVIEKAIKLRKLEQENKQLRTELHGEYVFKNLVAHSSQMRDILNKAGQVAQSDATVLLLGESGTGKELIARGIHYNSPRRDKPFVTINCPSIPETLLESELFGHVKGAFTGAISGRKGKFELADGGTLFLDEVADLHGTLQAKLLRVLQEHTFESVGSSQEKRVDVRIIAATNQDLMILMQQGKFRQDLYYRLSVVPIWIPPLREHRDDIPFLVKFFIHRYAKRRKVIIDKEALQELQNYSWPGNIRELGNTIEGILVFLKGDVITKNEIPRNILNPVLIGQKGQEHVLTSLPEIERNAITSALALARGNQSRAAKLLKIPRHVLLYRIKKYGIKSA